MKNKVIIFNFTRSSLFCAKFETCFCYCFGNIGPPESMREHVVAASKAMKKGDWKRCSEYILAVKVPDVNMKQIFTDRQTCNVMFVHVKSCPHFCCLFIGSYCDI